jgi:hypothetical protein
VERTEGGAGLGNDRGAAEPSPRAGGVPARSACSRRTWAWRTALRRRRAPRGSGAAVRGAAVRGRRCGGGGAGRAVRGGRCGAGGAGAGGAGAVVPGRWCRGGGAGAAVRCGAGGAGAAVRGRTGRERGPRGWKLVREERGDEALAIRASVRSRVVTSLLPRRRGPSFLVVMVDGLRGDPGSRGAEPPETGPGRRCVGALRSWRPSSRAARPGARSRVLGRMRAFRERSKSRAILVP